MGPMDTALDELRHHWGDAYSIHESRDGWQARRKDGRGGWIMRDDAEQLFEAIRQDYGALPVPREQ